MYKAPKEKEYNIFQTYLIKKIFFFLKEYLLKFHRAWSLMEYSFGKYEPLSQRNGHLIEEFLVKVMWQSLKKYMEG